MLHPNWKRVTSSWNNIPPPRLHLIFTLFSTRRGGRANYLTAILTKIGVDTPSENAAGFPRLSLASYSTHPLLSFPRMENKWQIYRKKQQLGSSTCTFLFQVFTGNLDRNTKVTSTFPSPVEARYVRIEATNWNAYKSLRFEVLGCLTSTSFRK